ncbi:MAG: hypothetical protein KA392_08780 [Candidatus Obscuribacter sp.]|nr:hypothetical protein [Candidatus Obscuribacter sp.]MBP6593695.1 hypothetical protein [Candidatus Obscuribacter sp.]MBP7576694.1 hypothetical protein [Candidatus Obscuribacter sp.]
MTFRLLVCALLAALTMSLVTSVALCKTEAECLEAIKAGNELIKKDPNDFRGYASRGCAYGYLKKHKMAEKDLLKAISIKPKEAGLYAHLAGVYLGMERYEEAVTASRKVVDLGGRSENNYNALLGNLCMAHKFDECMTKCDEVLSKFPKDAFAYFYRAISKNEIGTFPKSDVLSDLAEAHSLNPSDAGFKRIYDLALAGQYQKLNNR